MLFLKILFFLCVSTAFGQDVLGKGRIDWANQKIFGYGFSSSLESGGLSSSVFLSRDRARVHLLELLNDIPYQGEKRLGGVFETHRLRYKVVKSTVESKREENVEVPNGKAVQMEIGISMIKRPLVSMIYGDLTPYSDMLGPTKGGVKGYAGVVLDARGMGVFPQLFPILGGLGGEPIFDTKRVDLRWALKWGAVVWVADSGALSDLQNRIGRTPYELKVNSVNVENGLILLDEKSTDELKKSKFLLQALKEGRFAVLY